MAHQTHDEEDLLFRMLLGTDDPCGMPQADMGALSGWCAVALQSMEDVDAESGKKPPRLPALVRTEFAKLQHAAVPAWRTLLLLVALHTCANFRNFVGQRTPVRRFNAFLHLLDVAFEHKIFGTRADGLTVTADTPPQFPTWSSFVTHCCDAYLTDNLAAFYAPSHDPLET